MIWIGIIYLLGVAWLIELFHQAPMLPWHD